MKSMKEMIQEWDIKEILNEGADLNIPVKMAKKSLTKLVSEIEKHVGGSFDAGSDEYSLSSVFSKTDELENSSLDMIVNVILVIMNRAAIIAVAFVKTLLADLDDIKLS